MSGECVDEAAIEFRAQAIVDEAYQRGWNSGFWAGYDDGWADRGAED